jgi:hypothetical protein
VDSEDLRDLLKSGYDTHAAQIHSGDDFTARHHGRVSRSVGRRRMVRHAAVTGGAFASVSALAVGATTLVEYAQDDTGDSPASPSASPASTSTSLPAWVPPLPSSPAPGVVTDDATLRLVLDAQAPRQASAPPTSVACGAPAAPYVAPFFEEATARILRPDTLYPTYLDPSYVAQPDDRLLGLGVTDPDPAGQFFVSVSYVEDTGGMAWVDDPALDNWSGRESADYNLIAQQGVWSSYSPANVDKFDVDVLFGAVVVQGGIVVGHADLWSPSLFGWDYMATGLSTIEDVSVRDGDIGLVYDFAVGPLEHMLWCDGAAPVGPLDAYAVIGSRFPGVADFDYSFVWAGAVEFK